MTLGEKLSKLRKENNYTQEQLADVLGVSRQSISKWESDTAYPETDKLIEIGKLFNCSMDYLLKEDVSDKNNVSSGGKIDEVARKVFTKENGRRLKRLFIVIGALCAVALIVCVCVFAWILQKFNAMNDTKGEHFASQASCMADSCDGDAIEGGMFCKDHTCTVEGCKNQRQSENYCFYHTYAQQ